MWKYVIFILVFGACKTSKSTKNSVEIKNLDQIAKELIGENYNSFVSTSGDHQLVVSKPKFVGDQKSIFIVWDNKSSKVIFGPESIMGKVSWHQENELLIQNRPENIPDKNSSQTYSTILDITSGEKRSFKP